MDEPFQNTPEGAASHLKLSDDALAEILRSVGKLVRPKCTNRQACDILQAAFSATLREAFDKRIAAKKLLQIRQLFARFAREKDELKRTQSFERLRSALNPPSDKIFQPRELMFPPPPPAKFDTGRMRKWIFYEKRDQRQQLNAHQGGRRTQWWNLRAAVRLCAAYEIIFDRPAAATLKGPTSRFVLAFLCEARKAVRAGGGGRVVADKYVPVDVLALKRRLLSVLRGRKLLNASGQDPLEGAKRMLRWEVGMSL